MASFKKRRGVGPICTIAVVLGFCMGAYATEFAGGTGEPNDPYQIATAEQLIAIGADPNLLAKHFALIDDIDLDPNAPGGRLFNNRIIPGGFSGSFDGCGRTIHNLHIVEPNRPEPTRPQRREEIPSGPFSLFERIAPGGSVRNLRLEGVRVQGRWQVAGLTATNEGLLFDCFIQGEAQADIGVGGLVATNQGILVDCFAQGTVRGSSDVGGLVGINEGIVAYCSSDVVVAAERSVGGLIGTDFGGLVTHCSARAEITTDGTAGGLVGKSSGRVENCHASVEIVSGEGGTAGGLIGWMDSWSGYPSVRNCYADGRITAGPGNYAAGGLIGYTSAWRSIVSCSYAATEMIVHEDARRAGGLAAWYHGDWEACFFLHADDGGGPDNGVGIALTDAQMRSRDSFAGWDFLGDSADGAEDHWFMPEGSYPILTMEIEGTGLIHVPDLRGIDRDRVLTVIRALGLIPTTAEDYSLQSESGKVLEISPRGCLAPGDSVHLVLGAGPYDWQDNPADGSPSNPFQIQKRSQFLQLTSQLELFDKCFVLMCDIDLSGLVFHQALIGASEQNYSLVYKGTAFSGCFDGGLHTISNLTILPHPQRGGVSANHLGLFGRLAPEGQIVRLRVENASIHSFRWIYNTGLLCGENQGVIQDCRAAGEISYGNSTRGIGGLVGSNDGSVSRSAAESVLFFGAPVSSQGVGSTSAESGSIHVLRSGGTGLYRSAPQSLGMLVGSNQGRIEDCYASGSVTGSRYSSAVAGIAGRTWKDGTVARCYCAGIVADDRVSSAGVADGAEGSYYLRDPELFGPAPESGIGLSDAELRQQASFVGWDFVGETINGTEDIWTICEGKDYPRLAWEEVACED